MNNTSSNLRLLKCSRQSPWKQSLRVRKEIFLLYVVYRPLIYFSKRFLQLAFVVNRRVYKMVSKQSQS